MSENWLKMRFRLWSHPKVIRVASELCPTNVQSHAERMCTQASVIGGLLRLWALGHEHTTDGLLDGYTPDILDDEVGQPGFTQAMSNVGWITIEPNCLVIHEFNKHNGDGAKARAVDAARKRNVRKMSEVNRTELGPEKEKEKDKRKSKTKKARLFDTHKIDLPPELDTQEFRMSFSEWQEHHKQKTRKGMTKLSTTKLVTKMEAMGHDRAIAAIEHSITNGYQGLFEPAGEVQGRAGSAVRPGQTDAVARREAKAAREYP